MSTTSKAPRVLVLHGHFQSASTFRNRMAGLVRQCGPAIDFVFIDAPHILEAADVTAPSSQATKEGNEDPPRGWWNADLIPGQAVGLEESLAFLRDFIKGERFDGVFGFSQGAALAGLLAALLEKPEVYPPFLVDGKAPHPPLKFCVSVSGFQPPTPLSPLVFQPSYDTPTLHVIGRNDVIIIEERSHMLANSNSSRYKRVEIHDGGHFIPTKTSWRKFMCNWMQSPETEWPSPSSVPFSAPPSGVATPTSERA